MAADWAVVSLGEISNRGQYGFTASATEIDTGRRFLRTTDIVKADLDWSSVPFCEIDDEAFTKYRLGSGDLVISRMGSIGASAFIRDPPDAVFASYLIRFRIDDRIADPRFVFYALRSPEFKSFVQARGGSGSVQPNINARVLSEFRLTLPPIEEQRAIASVLGALDDKIELNRRMNETLEALARAIFTSWFVDFDPVRAKAEGRQPVGMDAETAALFPDSFEGSPLGPIPSGWRVGTLAELVSFSRQSLDPAEYPAVTFDHYSIPAFDDGRRPRDEPGMSIKSSKFVVPAGAVLLSRLNPRIRRVWLPRGSSERRSIASTEFLVSVPKTSTWREWIFCLYQTRAFSESIAGLATGTSGSHQRARPHDVLAYRLPVPPLAVVAGFANVAGGVVRRVAANLDESVTLGAARDALLPKLVSGDVRVRY